MIVAGDPLWSHHHTVLLYPASHESIDSRRSCLLTKPHLIAGIIVLGNQKERVSKQRRLYSSIKLWALVERIGVWGSFSIQQGS